MSILRSLKAALAGLCLLAAAAGAQAAPRTAASSTVQVGNLQVQSIPGAGAPVILIPGLGSGAWVWQDTVEHLRGRHALYVLTLSGFDGTAPAKPSRHLMALTTASLASLIAQRHIDHPVLVGHSLGGTLALQFAEQYPGLPGGVVAVDGLPVFPGFDRLPAVQRKAAAERMRAGMRAATGQQFRQQQQAYMRQIGLIDPSKAEQYAARQARSDPATVAEYMYEDLITDLRGQLGAIEVPVLEIAPYNAADPAPPGLPLDSASAKQDYYRGLLDGVKRLEVKSIAPARHFAMLDRPDDFKRMLDAFMQAHGFDHAR